MPERNAIQTFVNENLGSSIRVVDRNGEPWFVAKDVAKALGYSNTRHAIIKHCKGGRVLRLPSDGGAQDVRIISEPDIYRLVLRSKLPQAEAFQDWIVTEVLPSIRKHGAYMADSALEEFAKNPDSIFVMAQALLEERERRELAEGRLEVFKPRTRFGSCSPVTGCPRTFPVAGYFRSKRTTTITEITEYQRRLFDFDDKTDELNT